MRRLSYRISMFKGMIVAAAALAVFLHAGVHTRCARVGAEMVRRHERTGHVP